METKQCLSSWSSVHHICVHPENGSLHGASTMDQHLTWGPRKPLRIQNGCYRGIKVCLESFFWTPGLSWGFSKCLKSTRLHCLRQLSAIGADGRFLRIEHSAVCVWDTHYSMLGEVWGYENRINRHGSILTSGDSCKHTYKNTFIYPEESSKESHACISE